MHTILSGCLQIFFLFPVVSSYIRKDTTGPNLFTTLQMAEGGTEASYIMVP